MKDFGFGKTLHKRWNLRHRKTATLRTLSATLLAIASCVSGAFSTAFAEEQFKEYEIRVIKNKPFQKRFRLELGADLGAIMNQSFIYSYLGGAHMAFHFTEGIGIQAEGKYAVNANKSDCNTLGKDFGINPLIDELNYYFGGALVLTPIYGKYQLSTGDVLYFDWFFRLGGGLAGNREREGGCGGQKEVINSSASGLQLNVGTGQRFFIDKNLALVWNVRMLMFQPSKPGSSIFGDGINNVELSTGIGYFL
jgi:outer membrane beta-barrel protein